MLSSPIRYRAGAASECVTPNEPLWLAGYAVRIAPACGTLSDLYATALALEDENGQRFVIASVDLIAITPAISTTVFDQIYTRRKLSREQVLLTATHTHYGPEFRSDKKVFFNIPNEFAGRLHEVSTQLAAALVRVIEQALERLEPARLYVRRTTASFAHNRRRHGVKDGSPSAEDVIDHDVPILECVSQFGRRIAIGFGYACHATTIPPSDLRYSGDWPGFAKETIQQANDSAVALFLPGAGADQDPEPYESIELSRQHGEELAEAVQRSIDAPGVEITGPIRIAADNAPLPLEAVTSESVQASLDSDDPPRQVKGRFLQDALNRGETLITSYNAPFQVARFGEELLLIALSGEPVVDWALLFKREFQGQHFPHVWVAGYCNDMFGYVPTRRVHAEGGYEAGRATLWSSIPAPFTSDLEECIATCVRRLVQRVSD